MTNAKKYFLMGYHLTNQNISLFYVTAIFILLGHINAINKTLGINILPDFLLKLIGFILPFISIAYALSISIFLNDSLEKRQIAFRHIVKTSLNSLKRSILYIPLFFIAIVVFSIILIFITNTKLTDPASFQRFMIIAVCIFALFGPLVSYAQIFFGIEKMSLFAATKASIRFARQNLAFTYLISLLLTPFAILYTLSAAHFFVNGILGFSIAIVQAYIGFVASATYLLYYRSKR